MNGEHAALQTFETTKDDEEFALIAKRSEPVDRIDDIVLLARMLRRCEVNLDSVVTGQVYLFLFLRADQFFLDLI